MRIILPMAGLGDQLAFTAAAREFHVAHPEEPVELSAADLGAAAFLGNPHLTVARGKPWRVVLLQVEQDPHAGIAVSFGRQMGIHVVDPTPELYGVPKVERRKRRIAIDPGARAPVRRWHPERWVETVRRLRDAGWTTVEVGANVADHEGEVYPRAPIECDERAVDLELHDTAGVISGCSLYLGMDSGGAHLAAAVGTPQVVLYSRSAWHSRAYWNTVPVTWAPGCPKACARECAMMEPCLDQIHPEDVLRAVTVARDRHGA